MKKPVLALLLIACLFFLPQAVKRMTSGFHLERMILDVYRHSDWDTTPLPQSQMREIKKVLRRPFTYLSRGSQAFVFASEDGRYVLKLFYSPQKAHPWRQWIRTHVRKKSAKSAPLEKVHRVLSAAKLAFEQGSAWTGVVYVHLNPTETQLPETVLKAPCGKTCKIDLNQYRFVLQERAIPIREGLAMAIEQGDRSAVRALFHSFAELILTRASKGIRNGDVTVYSNFGCLGSRVIEWDFGNYWIDASMRPQDELQRFASPLRQFLLARAPEWVKEFDEEISLGAL